MKLTETRHQEPRHQEPRHQEPRHQEPGDQDASRPRPEPTPPRPAAGQDEPVSPLGSILVAPWVDHTLDRIGHHVRSPYVERFWLPVLGPSATWILRNLAEGLDRRPDGYRVDLATVARSVGLGGTPARNSPFLRGLERITRFGLARYRAVDELEVRRHVPPLSAQLERRLPAGLRSEHRERASTGARFPGVASRPVTPTAAEVRRRAIHLAQSLLELGEAPAEVEVQLHRWRFHPALAHEAVTQACLETGPRHAGPRAGPAAEVGRATRTEPASAHATPRSMDPVADVPGR